MPLQVRACGADRGQPAVREASDNFAAYGVKGHRHHPEIVQGLALASNAPVSLAFTPHLTPAIRGIFATLYAPLVKPDQGALRAALRRRPFVRRDAGGLSAGHALGARLEAAGIAVHRPAGTDLALVLAVEDNLVKGAAGQAIQNMNLMLGSPRPRARGARGASLSDRSRAGCAGPSGSARRGWRCVRTCPGRGRPRSWRRSPPWSRACGGGVSTSAMQAASTARPSSRSSRPPRPSATRYAQESAALRQANSALETELAMTRGQPQAALAKQVEELAPGEPAGARGARVPAGEARRRREQAGRIDLDVEKGPGDTWHYRILVVRGVSRARTSRAVSQSPRPSPCRRTNGSPGRQTTLSLPDDQPDAAGALQLRFKYYQRIEGTLRAPGSGR